MLYQDKEAYRAYADRHAPSSPIAADLAAAFWVGGVICAAGEALAYLYRAAGADGDTARLLVSVTFIAVAALLTGIGVYDRIARYAGGGTLVPVTGFANSVASMALDAKSEGWILGVGAKIFTVAGPVLFYGTLAGVLYGFVYWLATRVG